MPMYFDQIEQELDNVEARGAGRVPQEMAKSRYGQGLCPHPEGISSELMEHKMGKTKAAIDAQITQVLRREREG